jgi:hypothetical protein
MCPDGSSVARVPPDCEFEECPEIPPEQTCTDEDRRADACIEIYQPVCGWYDVQEVQCVTWPCANTFSNSCFACLDEQVGYWTPGECPETGSMGINTVTSSTEDRQGDADGGYTDGSDCSEPIMFDYPPVEMDRVNYILPLGAMTGGHVTPVDHQYYITREDAWAEVYSPSDGVITSIQHMGSIPGDDSVQIDDYRLEIEHTCSISSIFIHIDEVSDRIMEIAPPLNEYSSVRLDVEAGEVIGRYTGSVDYQVVDYDVFLTGFVIPESYNEPWKMHTPDPFDYFKEPMKGQMTGLCLRSADPVGGRIDYDIEGRLVGNWFLENTNKYEGITGPTGAYYTGHLAIAYDSIDPEHIVISMGDFEGEPMQFGVVGNSPDPEDVGIETGIVEYELSDFEHFDGEDQWEYDLVKGLDARNTESVHGVVLFQVLENNRLRMETFPGKTPSQVSGFTDSARTYER